MNFAARPLLAGACLALTLSSPLSADADSAGNSAVSVRSVFPGVVVRAMPRPPQAVERRISGDESRQVAGAGGDVIRAVSALPGAVPQNDFLANLLVRGSGEHDNLLLYDGFPLGYPYHFAGLESVIPSGVVGEAVLLSGGWDVRYGDAQGGVLELGPAREVPGLHGQAGFSAIQASGLLQYSGSAAAATVAYRRGFLDWVLTPGPSLVGLPRWQDYFASLRLGGGRTQLRLLAMGSDDRVTAQAQASDIPLDAALEGEFGWFSRFKTAGAVLEHHADASSHRLQLSMTDARQVWQGNGDVRLDQRPLAWRLRVESDFDLKGLPPASHRINLGFQWQKTDTRLDGFFARLPVELGTSLDYASLDTAQVHSTGSKALSSLWLQDRWQAMPALWIAVGTRLDRLDPGPEIHLSPRLFVEARPWEGGRLNATYGDYFQSPHALETVPGWTAGLSRGQLSRGVSAGVEQAWGGATLSLEFFSKDFERRLPRTVVDVGGNSAQVEFNAANDGGAQGFEAYLRAPEWGVLGGWLSYSYTQSARRSPGGGEYPADFSQPHVFNGVVILRPHPAWSFSFRHRLASGTPYTPVESRIYNIADQRWEPTFGAPNSKRLPWYQRSDARLEYTLFFEVWQLRVFYEVFNLFDHPNVTSATYLPDYSGIQELRQFPRIHFGGVEALF